MKVKYLVVILFLLAGSCQPKKVSVKTISAIVDGNKTFQTIDGFGVNFNPALWNNGAMKPAIDLLVDDLGATIFRFDCFGRANWLDPAKQQKDGTWPADYLASVYQSKEFSDAWQAFRYLNQKGIEPYFNVSGIVPPEWNEPGTKVLANFDAYAEMICTMLDWAKDHEKLKFSLLAPFNETNFDGSREGPAIPPSNRIAAVKAVVEALKNHHLENLKLAVFCDGNFELAKLAPLLADSTFKDQVSVISAHTYGNGGEGDGNPWYRETTVIGRTVEKVKASAYRNSRIWLNEYGDLDQTGDIENEFSWRISRRLMKAISEGVNSAQFWDACDNYHKHDSAWTNYGLLQTDTMKGQFQAKKRFYASKQIYKFVKPGFVRVSVDPPKPESYDVYREWHNPLKNINLLAFRSIDQSKWTIIGMSLVEVPSELEVQLEGLDTKGSGETFELYQTNVKDNCRLIGQYQAKDGKIVVPISARSIFTITNCN
jgi:hypothetical protein